MVIKIAVELFVRFCKYFAYNHAYATIVVFLSYTIARAVDKDAPDCRAGFMFLFVSALLALVFRIFILEFERPKLHRHMWKFWPIMLFLTGGLVYVYVVTMWNICHSLRVEGYWWWKETVGWWNIILGIPVGTLGMVWYFGCVYDYLKQKAKAAEEGETAVVPPEEPDGEEEGHEFDFEKPEYQVEIEEEDDEDEDEDEYSVNPR